MLRSLSLAGLFVICVSLFACGDDEGGGLQLPGAEQRSGSASPGAGDADGDSPGASGSGELPAELSDFPLPDDAMIPCPCEPLPNDRQTLAILVTSDAPAADVVALVDEGLQRAGYEIGDTHEVSDVQGAWSFTKDGRDGTVSVFPNAGGATSININLHLED